MNRGRNRSWRQAAAFLTTALLAVLLSGSAARSNTATFTIFSPAAVPAYPAITDVTPIEVGVKFSADSDGFVTALRFYKGVANTGTHVGHLWSASGQQLAEATFSGETASGWQQVQLAEPVAISAHTTYVASYWSPSGYFAYTPSYFTTGVDNPPLHAPSSGSSGGNGLYRYNSSGLPTSSYQAGNYWVDVVFSSGSADTSAPGVVAVSPGDNAGAVAVGSSVTARFDEPVDPGTLTTANVSLRDSGGDSVPAAVGYTSSSLTVMLTPNVPLAYSTTYTATIKGGAGGVTDTAGNALAEDYAWSFTTAAAPPTPPDQGPGGPILVVHSSADGFGDYLAEVLRTEGLNEFATTALSNLSAAKLAGYQVVILGHAALSDAQVSTLTTWVEGGGKLVAMRPDAKLAALLGLTSIGGTLTDGYLRVDTSSSPGAGITAATMQFHGSADRYATDADTRAVATLYSDATTATTSPAVTLRSVGSSGGQAAAFAYDLARSVVYTHQGNPAWAGQERDNAVDQGTPTIRSDDLFFGGSQPDYVDLDKVAIPQADEQQRLLANLVTDMDSGSMPLPRLWYFPDGLKAAIVMTGDAHPNGQTGTEFAFDRFLSQSPSNCSLADWTCVRETAYVQQGISDTFPAATAKAYEDEGFEIALHLAIPGPNACNNFSDYQQVKNALDQQLDGEDGFLSVYGALQPPATIRTHCIVWSDWDSQVRADLSRGIRLNTDYYYWPSSWVAGRSGMFTGAGIPMRFAAMDGSIYDVYQATTQLPDETFQTPDEMRAAVEALLDGALGPDGYYGFFTANVHNDRAETGYRASADAIVDAAQARGVPIITARQLLTWLDGRDNSSFQDLVFAGGQLRFTIAVGSGARGLQAMLPLHGPNGDLASITRDGGSVSFNSRTVKGVDYAFVDAANGDYVATYRPVPVDTTPPVITAVAAAPAADGSATISWSTDEAASSRVQYGTSPTALSGDVSDAAKVTSHSVTLSGLSAGTTYYFRVSSTDAAGNSATSPAAGSSPASFTVPDTTPPVITAVAAAPAADGSATISWSTDEAASSRVQYGTSPTALSGDVSDATRVTSHSLTLSGLGAGTTYYFRVSSTDAAGNSATSPAAGSSPASFTVPGPPSWTCPCSLFPSSATPASQHAPTRDGRSGSGPWSYELGVKLQVTNRLQLTAIRFYKDSQETGTHIGRIWSSSGTLLAQTTFTNETASGWQQQALPTLVTLQPGSTYVVSVGLNAYFVYTLNGLASQISGGPLRSVADGTNGVFASSAGVFPSQSYRSTNYFVDAVVYDRSGAPSVTGTAPTDGATGVSRTPTLSASFDRPLDPSSLNVQTFTLADASGTAVPASVSYDNSSYVATLTPTSPLQPGTTYTGRLTSGVRSWEGSQLAPSSFRFTTLALVVSQTAPVDGATDVDVGSTASATFSGPIDPASLTAQSFSLRDESGSTVPATIAYDAASITATLTPTSPLRYNTRYTATLTTGIRTPGGSGLARDYSFGFRTKSLLVTQVSPAQGATSIGSMATVKATFSAAADPSTLTTDSFALKDAGGTAVQATIAYDSSSKTATLTPSSPLRPQTTYTATLTGAIRGADGSTLANPSSWSFTTASCPCSLFPANPAPSLGHMTTRDGRGGSGPWSYELGVKIQVTSPVQLTAIRFYKDGSETGTHVGTVWSSSGAVLARTTFSGETASGWQLQALTAPLTLQPGQVYVVSVGFNAYFGETPSGLLAQITQGPLQSVADGRNGVYGSAAGVFPNQTYRSTSYLVDPVVR